MPTTPRWRRLWRQRWRQRRMRVQSGSGWQRKPRGPQRLPPKPEMRVLPGSRPMRRLFARRSSPDISHQGARDKQLLADPPARRRHSLSQSVIQGALLWPRAEDAMLRAERERGVYSQRSGRAFELRGCWTGARRAAMLREAGARDATARVEGDATTPGDASRRVKAACNRPSRQPRK